jgi:methionyl-tRNA synthetase
LNLDDHRRANHADGGACSNACGNGFAPGSLLRFRMWVRVSLVELMKEDAIFLN